MTVNYSCIILIIVNQEKDKRKGKNIMMNIRDYIIDSIINKDDILIVNKNDRDIKNVIINVCDEMMKTVQFVENTGDTIDSDIIVFDNVNSQNELIRDIAGALSNKDKTSVINIVNDNSVADSMHPAISSKFTSKFNV